ncbi:MAG: tetratricopeptide repeat protein [Acidobacteria bacterium]|nr:tetratricopeptide repeat protein [Acidobacteriota bacterium]
MRGQSSSAATYFSMLELDESEADAERLYYLAECARRGDDRSEMLSLIERLSARYPNSPWRLKALISAGNAFLLDNEHEKFEPLYEAAHANFAGQPEAAYPHWKLAWRSYLSRRRDAAERLRAHLIHYPSGSKASAALYFLGRMAESAQDFSSARAYYEKLLQQYPNFYHAVLARERLAERRLILAPAGPSKAAEFLTTVAFPERLLDSDSRPTPATLRRIERARLLRSAGLAEWAESELRFGARHDGQPRLLALELAAAASAPHQALRLMKSTAPNYLAADLRRAPAEFWERLFPLPYREDILRSSRLAGLDPFMVAALIRQESEFNPQAVSRANARGLTQVMPSTGRQLARRLKIRRFNNRLLFEPATNLRLGTLYLRGLLDEWGGRWEQALASYNAGATRVEEWLGWGDFREPAEFVETIPFTETREYVQSVIRNASIYRQLYSGTDLFAPAGGGSEARAARQPGGKKGS